METFGSKENQQNQQLANEYHILGQFDKHFNMSMIGRLCGSVG